MNNPTFANGELREGKKFASPFTRVLALSYYDGPTSGMVECGHTGPSYKFDILFWDSDGQELRVFALASLPPTAFQQLSEAFQRFWSPRWPVWVPMWQFPSEADRTATERLTKELLAQAGPTAWVIAVTDLLGEIVAAKATSASEISQVTDWGSFLGLCYPSVNLPARPL